MPTAPFALVQATVNGGAPVAGGITVEPNDIIQLSAADSSLWTTQLWEIYGFPAGYATPSGWTLSSGVLTSTDVTPPPFTISNRIAIWGKWGARLTVNGGIKNGAANAEMVDTATSFSLLSTLGQREIHRKETTQFGGWDAEYRANQKTIEAAVGHAGAMVATTDATPTLLKSFPMTGVSRDYVLRCSVAAVRDTGASSGLYDVAILYAIDSGGTPTLRNLTVSTIFETTGTMAITQNLVGSDIELLVTGVAATNFRWHLLAARFYALPYTP